MKILEYIDLDFSKVKTQYQKTIALLQSGDFYSAEVKKLNPTEYYRAKLDYTNRLLFKIISFENEKYLLLLEIIHQHTYEKSKFLKGYEIDESKIIIDKTGITPTPLPYINKNNPNIHVLDKIISFDDHQEAAFQLPCPVLIIGPAGSGKTALTIEKMKQYPGDIAYITHSHYLAHNSHQLYYANNAENHDTRNIDFLSYHEFIETISIPKSREVNFKDFSHWLDKFRTIKLTRDHHKLYEEFKGVISGTLANAAYLSKDAYLNLGIKQSIYSQEDKEVIYSLYQKYLDFLKQHNLHDINIISHDYLCKVEAKYDFIVIDEIQDFTNIQLLLILKALKKQGQFILCGDSNQIVHPNFFSWSKIKTLFHSGDIESAHKITRILHTNYRSAKHITDLANLILKIKNVRFGSVDKESNYLMESQQCLAGDIRFLNASDKNLSTLNEKSRRSIQYAVIVIRDEMKSLAKEQFKTPLVFSIHEAKGLEYDNIILYDFITSEEKAFLEISKNITKEDLNKEIHYGRIKDKTDRSIEVYKFYINALYVGITRAIKNIYWVESSRKHPLFDLLQLKENIEVLSIVGADSSMQEWQQEARKLELQGKQEQADAIRSQFIQEKPVPWEVYTREKAALLLKNALAPSGSKQLRITLLEYALVYHNNDIMLRLAGLELNAARNLKKSLEAVIQKHYFSYVYNNTKAAQQQITTYGVNFRNTFNQSLLMVAAYLGNVPLAKLALDSGINSNLVDNTGLTAFHIVLRQCIFDLKYLEKSLSQIYPVLVNDSLDIQVDRKLVKIDRSSMEYILFQFIFAFLSTKDSGEKKYAISAGWCESKLIAFPKSILPDYRKKRTYISSILSKNEVNSNNPYNRKLFKRIRIGVYVVNPDIKLKINDEWTELNEKNITQAKEEYLA